MFRYRGRDFFGCVLLGLVTSLAYIGVFCVLVMTISRGGCMHCWSISCLSMRWASLACWSPTTCAVETHGLPYCYMFVWRPLDACLCCPSPQLWRSPCALSADCQFSPGRRSGSAEIRFSFRPFVSSFRWRAESRLQSPQFPSSSHGCFVCKACRPVESEGPCARFPAVFVGCSRRQLVGCRRCRDTVVQRGVRRQISRCRGHGRRVLRWTLWRLNALRYRELV